MAFENILGKRFFKLIVTEQPKKSRNVRVKCDCGFERFVDKYDLIKGKIKTCRSKNCSILIKNIKGYRFGFLTAIEIDKTIDVGQKYWVMNCDCGNKISVPISDLIRGHTKSCGCKKGELISSKNEKDGNIVIRKSIYKSYKSSARNRKIDWDLTFDEFLSFLNKKCYYCGSEPYSRSRTYRLHRNFSIKYNGIDRVNNTAGYNMNNCVSCCFICNRSKNNLSIEEFLSWCDKISENIVRLKNNYTKTQNNNV